MKFALVLDIETRPDPVIVHSSEWIDRLEKSLVDNPPGNIKAPEKLAAWREKKRQETVERAALSAQTGLIAMMGTANCDVDTGGIDVFVTPAPSRETENRILQDFADALIWAGPGTQIVTWGGRRFDMPFLAARCGLHRIALPDWFPTRRSYREHLVDLCEDVFDGGRLSDWQYTYGLGHKDVEGAALLDISMSDLEAHLRDDLRHTRALALSVEWAWRARP